MGLGKTYLYDHYLSPLPYEGNSFLFSTGSIKPLKWNLSENAGDSFEKAKWFNQFNVSIQTSYCQSKAGSELLYGNLDLRNSLFRQIFSTPKWKTAVGGFTSISGGGRYSVMNGNNPGSADALLDLGITTFSTFQITIAKRNLKISYQGSLALAGIAFSPEYAESYYEIFYLKNYDNTLKYTSLINKQHWRQQLNLDIPLSHRESSLRLSYWNEGRISLLNNIRTRVLSDHFSVGYIRYFKVL